MRAWAWTIALSVWLIAISGRAEEPPRIAVVHELSADERAIGRLRAELSTLGLDVVDVTLAPNEGATSLDDAARRVDAFAAVHVVPAMGGVEVWIADRVTGKTLLRELVIGPGEPFDDVVALKAVEVLRASLVELGLSAPRREDVTPMPTVTAVVPPPRSPPPEHPRLFLELGPSVATSPGGLGATAGAFVGLRWRATTTFGVDAFGLLPISAATLEDRDGSAEVRPFVFGADVAAWFFEPDSAWQVVGAGGMGIAHLAIEGSAQPPLLGRADSSTVALPFARLSLARRLGTRFGLGLDGFVGIAAPRPVIRFDGREVADWGRPLVFAVLAFDVALD